MSKEKLAVAVKVARLLAQVEDLVDQAVAVGADLTAAMPRARIEANLPAVVGQRALDCAGEAMASLIAARRQIVQTHKHLDIARVQMGLPELAFGEQGPKPEFVTGTLDDGANMGRDGAPGPLRIAA